MPSRVFLQTVTLAEPTRICLPEDFDAVDRLAAALVVRVDFSVEPPDFVIVQGESQPAPPNLPYINKSIG